MNRKEFGLNLAKIRMTKNISAYELSLRIDKAHNYVHSVETGKINPGLDSILAIADALEIEPAEIFKKIE